MTTAYQLAKAEIGTVEFANGSNPKVIAYFKDAGHSEISDDATAWCAAFVGAMLKRAGLKGTGALNARSYLGWGEAIARKDAHEGDIVVFRRGDCAWQGHVAFLVCDTGQSLTVLGGNQRDSVSSQAIKADLLLGIRRALPGDYLPPPKSSL